MNNQQALQLATGQQPTVTSNPHPDIDTATLINEWKQSNAYVYQYARDFITLDNLVDGIPLNHQADVPFVADTTLPGLVRQIPRDSLEQLPVFSAIVNGTKNSIPALICGCLLKKYVFNEDTFGKGLLSTLQLGAEQALTRGYAPFMVGIGSMYNDFGSTLRLLHWSDTSPERGISDHNETGFDYVVANLSESRVKKILRSAKNNPNTTWDVEALKMVLQSPPKPKQYSIYESAIKQNPAGEADSPVYQFVTRYETGPNSTIITFCPEVSERPLRVLDNRSKWGYPRVMYLVIDPAALTPFGTSRVRLASPNANLMNIYYTSIAAMLLLNSKPPILKRGRFLTPVELKRGAVWEAQDENAAADLKNMDNGALEQFVAMANQLTSQIQTMMGQKPGGTTNLGKTGPGVKQQVEEENSSTNQITKILENFLRQYALVGLDTMLCEQDGEDDLIVDDDTKNAINELAPGTIGDNNTIHMVWPEFYAAIKEWSVEVTVSISKDQLEDKKRGDLQDMLVVLAQNAQELGPEAVQKVQEITNLLMEDNAPLLKPMTVGTPQPMLPPGAPAPMPAPAPVQ